MKVEQPKLKIDFFKLIAGNILDFDVSGLGYDDRLKYRKRLQEIRREKGNDFGYGKDVWDEYMLKMYLDEQADLLNMEELLFQEKYDYLKRLNRAWVQAKRDGQGAFEEKALGDFYEKYWDEERDGVEETRRYLGERANDPLNNSPEKWGEANDNNLDSGRKGEPRTDWFIEEESRLKPNQKEFVDFIKGLGNEVKVLDLGCGRGSALVEMLSNIGQLKPKNRINIDLDQRNIERLNRRVGSSRSIVADASEIPLADASVDFIVFNMVLADNYLTSKKQALIFQEILRVLKKNGYLTGSVGFVEKKLNDCFEKVTIDETVFWRKK